jgi:hypothetical protein
MERPMTRSLPCLATVLGTLLLAACATPASRTAPFNLVNATADSVTHVAVAPSGSHDFQDVDLGTSLNGGLNATAVQLPSGPCLRDVQITFTGERVSRLNAVDVCRTHGLRLNTLQGRTVPDNVATGGPAVDQLVN